MNQHITTSIKIGEHTSNFCNYAECIESQNLLSLPVAKQSLAIKQGVRTGILNIYAYINSDNSKRILSLSALAKKIGYQHISLIVYSGIEHIINYAQLAVKAGIDEISISIHNIQDQNICSYNNSIYSIKNFIPNAVRYGLHTNLNIVIFDTEDDSNILSIIKIAQQSGAHDIYVRYPDASQILDSHLKLLLSKDRLQKLIQKIYSLSNDNSNNIHLIGLPADLKLIYAKKDNLEQDNTKKIEKALANLFDKNNQPKCFNPTRCELCWLKPHCHSLIATKEALKNNENKTTNTANIILTSDCPNNCIFCTFKNMDPPNSSYPHTPIEEIEYQMQHGRQMGANELVFVGTEPLEYKELPEIISTAWGLGYTKIAIQTHAEDFANNEFVKRMQQAGLTEVRTGVYGKDEKTHDLITQTAGSFRRLMKAIENLNNSKIHLKLHTTVCRQNLDQLIDISILLHKQKLQIEEYKLIAPFTEDIDWYQKVVPTFTEVLISAARQYDKTNFWHKKIAEEMLLKLSNNLIPPCVVVKAKQKSKAPFRRPDKQNDSESLVKLQFSIKHVNPDGSIKADFFTHSRHDIKTTITCPYADSCPYANDCPGIYLQYAKAYGLVEFGWK